MQTRTLLRDRRDKHADEVSTSFEMGHKLKDRTRMWTRVTMFTKPLVKGIGQRNSRLRKFEFVLRLGSLIFRWNIN